eukprot:1159358-Pelagomonas_calceolata.AAC.5
MGMSPVNACKPSLAAFDERSKGAWHGVPWEQLTHAQRDLSVQHVQICFDAEATCLSSHCAHCLDVGAGLQERWYSEKLGLRPDERRVVVQHYIEGLHWVLEYYYRGVASWNWFYPHHHAPMASDMNNLGEIEGEVFPYSGALHWVACSGAEIR